MTPKLFTPKLSRPSFDVNGLWFVVSMYRGPCAWISRAYGTAGLASTPALLELNGKAGRRARGAACATSADNTI
jgi:hypothetical protein